MRSISLALNIQLCPNNRHVGNISSSTNPKLHCTFCWGIKNKLSITVIIMSLSENSSDIGSMFQLSKSKTPNIFVINSSFYVLLMFLCSEIEKSFHVQKPMDTIFNWECSIIIYICSTNHTESIWVL